MAKDEKELIRRAMSVLGKRSAAKQLTEEQKSERSRRIRNWWGALTPEERSAEMKRRAKVRVRYRAAKAKKGKQRS